MLQIPSEKVLTDHPKKKLKKQSQNLELQGMGTDRDLFLGVEWYRTGGFFQGKTNSDEVPTDDFEGPGT